MMADRFMGNVEKGEVVAFPKRKVKIKQKIEGFNQFSQVAAQMFNRNASPVHCHTCPVGVLRICA
jgi:hypothetical protein